MMIIKQLSSFSADICVIAFSSWSKWSSNGIVHLPASHNKKIFGRRMKTPPKKHIGFYGTTTTTSTYLHTHMFGCLDAEAAAAFHRYYMHTRWSLFFLPRKYKSFVHLYLRWFDCEIELLPRFPWHWNKKKYKSNIDSNGFPLQRCIKSTYHITHTVCWHAEKYQSKEPATNNTGWPIQSSTSCLIAGERR